MNSNIQCILQHYGLSIKTYYMTALTELKSRGGMKKAQLEAR